MHFMLQKFKSIGMLITTRYGESLEHKGPSQTFEINKADDTMGRNPD